MTSLDGLRLHVETGLPDQSAAVVACRSRQQLSQVFPGLHRVSWAHHLVKVLRFWLERAYVLLTQVDQCEGLCFEHEHTHGVAHNQSFGWQAETFKSPHFLVNNRAQLP